MRNFIIWTISILLGFEPALWAQGKAEQQAQVKAFIEKTQIAKRPVSIREMYDKNANLLSPSDKSTLKKFVETYGNQKLPKMDVTKIKGRDGEENYQLQFVQNGQSVTLEIINKGEVFARLNGKVLSMNDMQSIEGLMIKAGVSVADAKKNFGRVPASHSDKALTINQLKRLSKSEQSLYFKQLRQLLESMEAVENSIQKKNTSSLDFSNRFEVVARWLQGETAWAANPTSCVAAGWPARTGLKGGQLKCGTDGKGVAEAYRKRPKGDLCPANQFVCNPSIYGTYGANGLCVDAGPNSTKDCNNGVIEGKDIPDLSKADDGAIAEAMEAAEEVKAICSSFEEDSSSSDSSDAPAKQSNKKKAAKKGAKAKKSKGGSKPNYSGLTTDQKNTCTAFDDRYNQINSWKCTNEEFAGSHPNICEISKGGGDKPAPGPAPAPPAPPTTGKMRSCSELPNELAPAGTKCDGGSDYPVEGPDEVSKCLDGVKMIPIIRCDCSPGVLTGKFRCTHPKGDEHGGGKAEAAAKKKGPNWLLIGGVALGGLFLFHWLNKKSQQQYYKTIEPIPPQPPVAPPEPLPPPVAEPVPRGAG